MQKHLIGLVSYSDYGGGASRAFKRWENLLYSSKNFDYKTFLFHKNNVSYQYNTTEKFDHKVAAIATQLQAQMGSKLKLTDGGHMSLNLMPSIYGHKLMREPVDIFNFHWCQGEMMSINQISKITQPIIWTLHDPWIINGIGHYRQMIRSGFLGTIHKNLNMWTGKRKQVLLNPKNRYIAPSEWIAQELVDFGIASELIKVIPNPIDLNTFSPKNKQLSRKKLSISQNKLIVLFGAGTDFKDLRKGFDLGIRLLEKVSAHIEFELVTFGHKLNDIEFSFKTTHLGQINDDDMLANLYSSADITLVPSRIDNLPQVMTESLACGTPVFTFPSGGPQRIISSEFGTVANSFELEIASMDFLQMIKSINTYNQAKISNAARLIWNEDKILKDFEAVITNLK